MDKKGEIKNEFKKKDRHINLFFDKKNNVMNFT